MGELGLAGAQLGQLALALGPLPGERGAALGLGLQPRDRPADSIVRSSMPASQGTARAAPTSIAAATPASCPNCWYSCDTGSRTAQSGSTAHWADHTTIGTIAAGTDSPLSHTVALLPQRAVANAVQSTTASAARNGTPSWR